jgi:radical SAM protein with 4Fe4S-binding SPASM domain
LKWLKTDWQSFRQSLRSQQDLNPGLYAYPMLSSQGANRRFHLRVHHDRSGVLFVDVTDVVHLNQTATRIAKMALDQVPQSQAVWQLQRQAGTGQTGRIQTDVRAIYEMIQRYLGQELGCPTCAIESLDRKALFSLPVSAPFKADLAITYQCNNDCPHCYNEADRLTLKSMGLDDWCRVVDRLNEAGVPHLIFTGGEATLYPELPQLINYANGLGHVCGLNSNGRRISDPNYARTLADSGLNHIQITLGSHRREVHDRIMNARCFEQTVQGIRQAIKAGLHTITNTTLMQMNAPEIDKTIDFLFELGIRTFAINGMIYSGGGFDTGQSIREELMPPILVRIRDHAQKLGMKFLWYTPTMYCRLSPVELEIGAKRCNAGEYSMCVEPNADVLPCQSYYVAAGNLLRDPWEKIWNGGLFQSFRHRQEDPQRHGLPEVCWQCPDLPLCGGGCRIQREAEAGVRISNGTSAPSGCSSGGCGSGGCQSGGCETSKSTVQISFASSQSDAQPRGFVKLKDVYVSHPSDRPRRRGTGLFTD